MIRKVVLKKFKRFEEQEFNLEGHVVLAGPNNAGKTTLLQAIAAWHLALQRWRELNNFHARGGSYALAPIARQAFYAVPVRNFEWLWSQRRYQGSVFIEVQGTSGWKIEMELRADSTEQINVHPTRASDLDALRNLKLGVTLVPPMTGLSIDEPVYQKPKLDQLLGLGRPGEVIRNLLLQAHQSPAWNDLSGAIQRLFGYELVPPDGSGADIRAEYRVAGGGAAFDISSAGSGFQQVLMLLAFLHTRPGSVLLLDEPDAHLHVILQDTIYAELRAVAARSNSQLIIATHSEVIIDSVPPEELCLFVGRPRRLVDTTERARLVESLGIVTQSQVATAMDAKGILYVEGRTDLDLLREFAGVLQHQPVHAWLGTRPLWHAVSGCDYSKARVHHDALRLVRDDLPGLVMLDGDAHPNVRASEITGQGLQRVRWRRYEIESYLFHPAALARYVAKLIGAEEGSPIVADRVRDMHTWMNDNLPPAVVREPLGDHEFLRVTKAREQVLPPILAAAGFQNLPYTRYFEIAALMKPEEVHSEVREKLDAIAQAFGL